MKYGILANIHANLEALDAVLAEMDRQGVAQWIAPGDLVGGGVDPSACLQRLRDRGARAVQGFFDSCVLRAGGAGPHPPAFPQHPEVWAAARWTWEKLSADDRSWLRTLPLTDQDSALSFAHSSFHDAASFEPLVGSFELQQSLAAMPRAPGFVGCSHQFIAYRARRGGQLAGFEFAAPLRYARDERVLIDAGSVGRPGDGQPEAFCVIFDPQDRVVTVARIAYDVETAADKIERAGLPAAFAEELRTGSGKG